MGSTQSTFFFFFFFFFFSTLNFVTLPFTLIERTTPSNYSSHVKLMFIIFSHTEVGLDWIPSESPGAYLSLIMGYLEWGGSSDISSWPVLTDEVGPLLALLTHALGHATTHCLRVRPDDLGESETPLWFGALLVTPDIVLDLLVPLLHKCSHISVHASRGLDVDVLPNGAILFHQGLSRLCPCQVHVAPPLTLVCCLLGGLS